jgi:hypothetical protein
MNTLEQDAGAPGGAEPRTPVAGAEGPSLGLLSRAVAIFVRPTQAWTGLERKSQWWFPWLLVALVSATLVFLTYDRTLLPMILDPMQKQVADGTMPQAQLDKAEAFLSGPLGRSMVVGSQFITWLIFPLIVALIVWAGGAFILGRPFGYRLALETTTWGGLIVLPAVMATHAIAWFRDVTIRHVHIGFGALLPATDEPSKLTIGLATFLDAIGPFAIWQMAVVSLGVAALSGAPRKSAAWVIGGLYVAIMVIVAAFSGLTARTG